MLKKEDGSGKKLWRLVDDERDWIIIQDGDTLKFRIRSNATGTPVDTDVEQSSWNIDRID